MHESNLPFKQSLSIEAPIHNQALPWDGEIHTSAGLHPRCHFHILSLSVSLMWLSRPTQPGKNPPEIQSHCSEDVAAVIYLEGAYILTITADKLHCRDTDL